MPKPPLSLSLRRLAFRKLGPIFPTLFGAWAYRLWFSTRRFKPPKREQSWIANARKATIELAGIPVMTYQWGQESAPLVVLVHGWNGRGSQMAAFAEPLVQAGFRVLSYDAPGHGHTPGNSTNIFMLSDTLKAITENIAPIHAIVAHSFGGMVTSLALSQGLQAQSVVLLSTPAHFAYLIDLYANSMWMPPSVRNNLAQRLHARFGDKLFDEISTVTTCQNLEQSPALIIHDEKDHDLPITQAEQIHKNWLNSELYRTSGLGHQRILYNEKVIEAVTEFLCNKNNSCK